MTDETATQARLAAVEARLEQLEDEHRIRALIARYCYLADAKRDDDLVELFTEDGELGSKIAGTERVTRGIEAIRAQVADPAGHQRPDVYGQGLHLLGHNLVIEVDGDTARASSYSLYVLRQADGTLAVSSASSNEWRMRRVERVWKIAARHRRPIADADFAEVLLIGHASF
jgi:hypothetical protein